MDDALRGALGTRLVDVAYNNSSGADWPNWNSSSPVHEVDLDVRLAFERAVIVTSWAMEGLTEGIDVSLDHDALPNATNVQGTPRWRPFVGQTLQEAAASWHVPNEGCPVTLWAIRLTFTHASSVSIALGEIEDGDVQYQPDALLVLFGESAARAYRPPAALDNALGSPLG